MHRIYCVPLLSAVACLSIASASAQPSAADHGQSSVASDPPRRSPASGSSAPAVGAPLRAPAARPSVGAVSQSTLSLERALVMGGAISPSIAAEVAGVDVATTSRLLARLRPNPEVSVEAENLAGSGAYRGLRSVETTVRMALPLELGGKRPARIAVANSQIDRARIGLAIARADLELAIRQSFADAAAAELRLAIALDQANLAEQAARTARVRVTAGVASPIEQQRAEVLRINAQTQAERAERINSTALANLSRLLGQPIDAPLDRTWLGNIGTYGPTETVATRATLAYVAAAADVRVASAQVRLARAQRIPDVTVSAGARRLAASNDIAAVVGVAVPIPFFNNGRAAVAQAEALQTQAEARQQVALLEAERQIASARTDSANAAATARTLSGPALTAAAEAARIARIGYGAGKLSQLELLEAERTLAQTRIDAVDALAAYHDAEARLRRLTTPATLESEQ